jgi:hypothetical protein
MALLLDTTPVQEEAFKASFRMRRIIRVPVLVSVFAALLAVLIELSEATTLAVRLGVESWVVHVVAGSVLALAILFWLVAWRCPACRRFLGAEVSPSFCRACGCPFD